jgi:hypothetical protein
VFECLLKNVFVFRSNFETGIVTLKFMCIMFMEVNICYDPCNSC